MLFHQLEKVSKHRCNLRPEEMKHLALSLMMRRATVLDVKSSDYSLFDGLKHPEAAL